MSDGLRIDLAPARAAALTDRAANDARFAFTGAQPLPTGVPSTAMATAASGSFSPLAVLLARFLPPHAATTPPPMPTPDEARLLQAWLQQRVVAVLRAAGVAVPPALRVGVDADGALQLVPAPAAEARLAPLLRHEPDIARLAEVLQRAVPPLPPASADPAFRAGAREAAWVAPDAATTRTPWPWWLPSGGGTDLASRRRLAPAPVLLASALAALLLAWWLLA